MGKKVSLLIGLCIVLLVVSGCYGPSNYTDGTCGSLCIQKECGKKAADCDINVYGEILRPSENVSEYCINFCYDGRLENG